MAAQPFFYPSYRARKRDVRRAVRGAITQAIRNVART
jgi:hypothetical protein